MRVLVACEFSQIVTRNFRELGHEAYSCDIIPTEGNPSWHIQDDVLNHLGDGWDLMIAHPECTYLSYAGERWFKSQPERHAKRLAALVFFFRLLYTHKIPYICVENPRGYPLKFVQSTQVIQPHYFGDNVTKVTHLWLKNLPPLLHTSFCPNPYINWTKFGHRSKSERSRTFPGIARAMATQWSSFIEKESR